MKFKRRELTGCSLFGLRIMQNWAIQPALGIPLVSYQQAAMQSQRAVWIYLWKPSADKLQNLSTLCQGEASRFEVWTSGIAHQYFVLKQPFFVSNKQSNSKSSNVFLRQPTSGRKTVFLCEWLSGRLESFGPSICILPTLQHKRGLVLPNFSCLISKNPTGSSFGTPA